MAKRQTPQRIFLGLLAKKFCPSSSPDCNLCDYYLWSILERNLNSTSHLNLVFHRTSITERMSKLDRDTISRVCKKFCRPSSAIIRANGGSFALNGSSLRDSEVVKKDFSISTTILDL